MFSLVCTEKCIGVNRKRKERLDRQWEASVKTQIKEIVREGADWIELAQDNSHCRAFVNTVM
jgi:hypothetical protein